jgi:hypothetical protein
MAGNFGNAELIDAEFNPEISKPGSWTTSSFLIFLTFGKEGNHPQYTIYMIRQL